MQKLVKSAFQAANKAAGLLGFRLSRNGSLGRDWDTLFGHLGRLGFEPQTIIDVGVASGSDEIYRHFPSAKYYLIEALSEFEPVLKRLCGQLDAEYFLAAAGAEHGSMKIYVHSDLAGSSVHREIGEEVQNGQERTVDVIRIDDVVPSGQNGPRLLKIDVQGAELAVLDGAQECLKRTDVVVLETSLIATMHGAPEFAELVSYMRARGFVVFDMIGGLQRPLDGSLAQVDLVFIPETHHYRSDRRWQH